ncbi:MAG TPA: hypothetical protein DD414_11410 [Lachnospiraceae bacterium]|nr:hypothetical protein [Lachnospiraceae bacterium]
MMELNEIHASMVTLEVTDEATGETFRRELPIDFYETANFLRLKGEDLNGNPSELVFVSDTGMRRLKDLTGHGADSDPCGTHS